VLKLNILLKRLPRLKAARVSSESAFSGTFHVDEGYDQMRQSYERAGQGALPERIPCELYCHTLTDDSILSADLRARGFHTLTLFALDTPWRIFSSDNEAMRHKALAGCLAGLNAHLAEPIEDCLARGENGEPCLEAKSPVDLENELGLYRGNIFHGALQFPFAERPEEVGCWGVETEFSNVFYCGASAKRGGGVSGIPGRNAAMKVIEAIKTASIGD
jgi:phytoene dehydrogenase-like protein